MKVECKNCGKKYNGIGKYFCSYKCSNTYPKTQKTIEKHRNANKGSKNGMWKGNNVGMVALHEWIKNHKPKPKLCVNCKKNEPYDLANISGKYKRDINDFEWLCRKCHMTKDGRLKKLQKSNIQGKVVAVSSN